MKRKAIKKFVGASFILGMLLSISFTLILNSDMPDVGVVFTPEVKEERTTFKPVILMPLADNDPGSGASGVMTAYVAVKDTTYTGDNLTAGEYYEFGETNDTSLGDNVPYDKDHDLVIAVRWNKTHAYNATEGAWNLTLVRAYVNCTDLSLTAEKCEEAEIGHDDTYIWVHYYIEDQTIARSETVEDVIWNFEYYG